MASVDLKDAYYSIPISVEDRNFLKFEWQGNYFRFTCLPNGLASAPRLFTKVLKPIYAHLRSLGHFCMGHIDDSFLMGHTYTSCEENIWETTNVSQIRVCRPPYKVSAHSHARIGVSWIFAE